MGQLAVRPDGEARAEFERLVTPLLGPLYNAAYGFVHQRENAEDAVAETVARAWRAFEQFEAGTNFKAWLFRILTNLCINRFRREERGPETVAFEDLEREAERAGAARDGASSLPDAVVLGQMLDEEVETALRGLPEDYRMVVVLSDIHELSYLEIARALEVPVGTVRSRLFRGRRLLRRALADYALQRGLLRESDLA